MKEITLNVKNLTTKLKLSNQIYSAVDSLSFELKKGKTLAIVGESGSGKSLTAMSLMRILPMPPSLPSEGEVLFHGKNLLTLPEKEMRKLRGSKMAMIFQDPMSALNPVYSIGEQLLEVTRWHLNADKETGWNLAINALTEVGITFPEERMHVYPHQLSGGMKQRIMIAMALLGQPEILIADEPTTALDTTIQAQVLDLMLDLQKKRGMSILLITHDMSVVAKMADEVIVMYASHGVEQGTAFEIFNNPSHPYTKALFKSRPSENIFRGQLEAIKGTVPPLTNFPSGCHFHPRCPYVMPRCLSGEVPEFPIKDSSQKSKCWLYE